MNQHNNQAVYNSSDAYIDIGVENETQSSSQLEPLLSGSSSSPQHVIHILPSTASNSESSSTPHQFLSLLNGARNHLGERPSVTIQTRLNHELPHHSVPEDRQTRANWWSSTLRTVFGLDDPIWSMIHERYASFRGSSSTPSAVRDDTEPETVSTGAPNVVVANPRTESGTTENTESNAITTGHESGPRPIQATRVINFPRMIPNHSPAFVDEFLPNFNGNGGIEANAGSTPRQNQPNISTSTGIHDRAAPPAHNVAAVDIDLENQAYEMIAGFLNQIQRSLPFICILLIKSVFDHWLPILDLFILQAFLFEVNKFTCKQVANINQRNTIALYRELVWTIVFIFFRFSFAHSQADFLGLLINPADDPGSLSQLLYAVTVNDMILKHMTVVVKLAIIIEWDVSKPRSRGRMLALVEAISQLYRSLAPIKPILLFLLVSYTGPEIIFGMCLSSVYMGAKAFEFVERSKLLKSTFRNYFKIEREPTKEELSKSGNVCPICHDSYDKPIVLECKHIFCEICVETWFKREQTCPMCRAKVADVPSWQNGATSQFYQLF